MDVRSPFSLRRSLWELWDVPRTEPGFSSSLDNSSLDLLPAGGAIPDRSSRSFCTTDATFDREMRFEQSQVQSRKSREISSRKPDETGN